MEFTHIKVLIGIFLSFSITHILRGCVRFIQHPDRYKVYWIHLMWAAYVFVLLIHLWWWEFKLISLEHWNFGMYFFVTFYFMTYYVLAAILFPDDIKDYKDYENYYYSRRKWFFGVLMLSFLLDIGDTLLKGPQYIDYLGVEYTLRIASHILLCLIAMRVKNIIYHGCLVLLFLIYELSYIYRLYSYV